MTEFSFGGTDRIGKNFANSGEIPEVQRHLCRGASRAAGPVGLIAVGVRLPPDRGGRNGGPHRLAGRHCVVLAFSIPSSLKVTGTAITAIRTPMIVIEPVRKCTRPRHATSCRGKPFQGLRMFSTEDHSPPGRAMTATLPAQERFCLENRRRRLARGSAENGNRGF